MPNESYADIAEAGDAIGFFQTASIKNSFHMCWRYNPNSQVN